MAIKQKISSINRQDDEIDKLLYLALQQMGAIIPTTVDEVEKMEKRLESDMNDFPHELDDSQDVFTRGKEALNRSSFFMAPRDTNTEIELARVAREGRKISDEVEKLMLSDRENAENNQ